MEQIFFEMGKQEVGYFRGSIAALREA